MNISPVKLYILFDRHPHGDGSNYKRVQMGGKSERLRSKNHLQQSKTYIYGMTTSVPSLGCLLGRFQKIIRNENETFQTKKDIYYKRQNESIKIFH